MASINWLELKSEPAWVKRIDVRSLKLCNNNHELISLQSQSACVITMDVRIRSWTLDNKTIMNGLKKLNHNQIWWSLDQAYTDNSITDTKSSKFALEFSFPPQLWYCTKKAAVSTHQKRSQTPKMFRWELKITSNSSRKNKTTHTHTSTRYTSFPLPHNNCGIARKAAAATHQSQATPLKKKVRLDVNHVELFQRE